MPKCLYCQQDNPPGEAECDNCGMLLPALSDGAGERGEEGQRGAPVHAPMRWRHQGKRHAGRRGGAATLRPA